MRSEGSTECWLLSLEHWPVIIKGASLTSLVPCTLLPASPPLHPLHTLPAPPAMRVPPSSTLTCSHSSADTASLQPRPAMPPPAAPSTSQPALRPPPRSGPVARPRKLVSWCDDAPSHKARCKWEPRRLGVALTARCSLDGSTTVFRNRTRRGHNSKSHGRIYKTARSIYDIRTVDL